MAGQFIEHKTLKEVTNTNLADDITFHLYARSHEGNSIVITSQPVVILRLVRRTWVQVIKAVQKERAKTVDLKRIKYLQKQHKDMEDLIFTTKYNKDFVYTSVKFVTPKQFLDLDEKFRTIYVGFAVDKALHEKIFNSMDEHGVAVVYKS